ncbi:pwwp domain-containing protein [Rutstroemia sp. NJR-2017a BBW]|nr:pwwp domain-containing protein [Rutstroemia sp. NJR-2017a BBW]
MAEETGTREVVVPIPATDIPAADSSVAPEGKEVEGDTVENGAKTEAVAENEVATAGANATEESPAKDGDTETKSDTGDKQKISESAEKEDQESSAPAGAEDDLEMKDEEQLEAIAPAADGSAEPADGTADTPASASKSKSRRKSGIPEHKKKLNKKQSKAKMTHIDAKPGDYFFVRLKGYPLWPAIVCDEAMLPTTLLRTRPVTAMRADGTYRADYEDGGPKAKDRTFPVMYLYTNEFGWIPNYDLVDLDFETVGDVPANMRKDLYAAHKLAAEKHDLDHFKGVLTDFMEQKQAEEEAKEAASAAKKASKAKKEKASKPVSGGEDNEDTEMMDASAIVDEADAPPKSNQKKRKNPPQNVEEDAQPPDSVPKKPRIKLNNTPKAVNGTATPKSAKEPKSSKKESKPKKAAAKPKEPAAIETPPEPELSPEEKRNKKEKEILFLRHKLQKGLLTKDQQPPKEEEMKQMSEYVGKLEGYADLEVSIIRVTKINKVLKAILKLNAIPKEEEFQFKSRSQSLLDKWNKLLASEPTASAEVTANGTSEEPKADKEESKPNAETENGVAENDDKTDDASPVLETPLTALPKDEVADNEEPTPAIEEPAKETEPATVESTA